MTSRILLLYAENDEYDDFAHGLVGNLSGIKPDITPCARERYKTDRWPTLTVNSMFPGPDMDARVAAIELVSKVFMHICHINSRSFSREHVLEYDYRRYPFISQGGRKYDCFRIYDGVVIRKDHHTTLRDLMVECALCFVLEKEAEEQRLQESEEKRLLEMEESKVAKVTGGKKKATKRGKQKAAPKPKTPKPSSKRKILPNKVRDFQELAMLCMFPGHISHVEVISSPTGESRRGPFFDLR